MKPAPSPPPSWAKTGKDDVEAWIAVNGVVYDVTAKWPDGRHHGLTAGCDLTEKFVASIHATATLQGLPVVGRYEAHETHSYHGVMADRDALLAAAHAEFAKHGYAKTAMAEIAQRAGMAVGSVYNTFPSKRDLFVEVYRAENAASKQRIITEVDWSEPKAAMMAFVAANLEALRTNRILGEWYGPSIGAHLRDTAGRCHLLNDFYTAQLLEWRRTGHVAPEVTDELIDEIFEATSLLDRSGQFTGETMVFIAEALLDRVFPTSPRVG